MAIERSALRRATVAALFVLGLFAAGTAQAANVTDDFRVFFGFLDQDQSDSDFLSAGYTHYFTPLRSESDLPFNFEWFFSHPSSIGFNISSLEGDQPSPFVGDLVFNTYQGVGQWFFKERMGVQFSIERTTSKSTCFDPVGFGCAGGVFDLELFDQTLVSGVAGFQHYYTEGGAWSFQVAYSQLRNDVLQADTTGTDAPFFLFDDTDSFTGFRGEWTQVFARKFRAQAAVFVDVTASTPQQGLFPSQQTRLPGTPLENKGGQAEFEWAFARAHSVQFTGLYLEDDNSDLERTSYGVSYTGFFTRRYTVLVYLGRTEDSTALGDLETDEIQVGFRIAVY